MIDQLQKALGRKLTEQERRHIEWLQGWGTETCDTFNGLFDALYKAGQADANFAHEAMTSGERQD